MPAKPDPQALFPNLFGKRPQARRPAPQSPFDLRLVQLAMRQAARRAPLTPAKASSR